MFDSERWERLEALDARPQRPLWASTGVKDPSYDDTRYVVELVAPGSVNTMPEATLRAVADHGVVRGETIRGGYREAQQVMDDLRPSTSTWSTSSTLWRRMESPASRPPGGSCKPT